MRRWTEIEGRLPLAIPLESPVYLSKRDKSIISRVASDNWRKAKAAYPGSPNRAHLFAVKWTEVDIRSDWPKSKYGSIITSIIISLAIRFATKLLLRWLKEEFGE